MQLGQICIVRKFAWPFLLFIDCCFGTNGRTSIARKVGRFQADNWQNRKSFFIFWIKCIWRDICIAVQQWTQFGAVWDKLMVPYYFGSFAFTWIFRIVFLSHYWLRVVNTSLAKHPVLWDNELWLICARSKQLGPISQLLEFYPWFTSVQLRSGCKRGIRLHGTHTLFAGSTRQVWETFNLLTHAIRIMLNVEILRA